MTPEFEAARARYINAWKEMKESVKVMAAATPADKRSKIMDDIGRDLSKIEANMWDALPRLED